MAESVINVGVESTVEYSSKVTPIFDDETSSTAEIKSKEQAINVSEISSVTVMEVQDSRIVTMPEDSSADEFPDEHNPQDRWLPITESRNGSILTATFHLLCSGIGVQALLLPLAFVSLGWFWGILCLSVAYSWQLYTTWLLVNLHESTPQTGIRYSRFLHLSIVAFGEKLGKLLAIFPTLYLSSGTCIIYIITGGTIMELFFKSMCENNVKCEAKTLTGAEWFLVFILLAIFIAQFFPNLNSLASISLIGSIAALVYVCILCVMSVTKGRPDHGRPMEAAALNGDDNASEIRNVFNGFGIIALAFRGHNLVLEIQGTIPTNRKQPSRKSMWRGVIISYLLIAISMYPLAIVGYWAYGHQVPIKGGILSAFTYFHQKSTSKYIIGAIYLIIIINYLCAFQIYAMPAFDNFERIYTSNKNKPCPRWLRSAIKVLFGGLTHFIAVAFPFLPRLGALVGSIGLPLTLVYPCLMWVAIKKPGRFSRMWCLNLGLGFSGIVLSVVCFSAALWSLIVNGLEANFFKPR